MIDEIKDLAPQAINFKPDYHLAFFDGNHHQIGRLDFNGPTLKFEGDAEPCAQAFMDYLAKCFAGRLASDKDMLVEAMRKAINAQPRYSFLKDEAGNVRRVEDGAGNWIEWSEAHALFDPVVVDALMEKPE